MKDITELLGIRYPVLQGGMAWISEHRLAAAVSNGGGLGIIAAGSADADFVRSEIRKAKTLTDKPFGVNIMLMSPFAADIVQVVIEEKVHAVTTGAGNPAKYMDALKAAVDAHHLNSTAHAADWNGTAPMLSSRKAMKPAGISEKSRQ